jgi:serine/threonine protein kinase
MPRNPEDCPDASLIWALVAGELNPAELVQLDAHLATCDDCLEVVSAAAADASASCVDEPSSAGQDGGETLAGRFEIVRFIARGGMGEVYEGLNRLSGEPVAIKCLTAGIDGDDTEALLRFTREGEILGQLNHRNIVRMLEIVHEGSQHHIVMEYVPGGSLRDLLWREGRLPRARALRIALSLADALACAHQLRIIHRDIKPENVLLAADGTPRLADFGLARMGEQRVTRTGALLGTVAYLSPEALRGQNPDERADIWGLGVMLFEMLAGRHPFKGDRPSAMVTAILRHPPPDLESVCPHTPPVLVQLINRMLEKEVDRRSSSMRHIRADIEAILNGTGSAGADS